MPFLVLIREGVWFLRRADFRLFPLEAAMAFTMLPCATALAYDRFKEGSKIANIIS
jgi:hypothetical protein